MDALHAPLDFTDGLLIEAASVLLQPGELTFQILVLHLRVLQLFADVLEDIVEIVPETNKSVDDLVGPDVVLPDDALQVGEQRLHSLDDVRFLPVSYTHLTLPTIYSV